MDMLDVEQAIREVGSVYQALTGRDIEAGRSELPAEVEPRAYIEGRYRQLKGMLESPQQMGVAPNAQPYTPPLEVVEHGAEVRFEMDLPAVSRDQVSVSLVGDWIVVRGRRGSVQAPGAAVRYSERSQGAFQRTIALPPRARRDAVCSALRDGVLTVTVPLEGPTPPAQSVTVKG
jgi:HSP20 family molecular chaperone IbpA